MTVKEVNIVLADKSMQNKETNFKVKGNGGPKNPPKYFIDFYNEFLKFVAKQEQNWAKQEQNWAKQKQFNQFVIDQFKAHGWVK